ncbi:DUF4148 domain-containing protein [Pandoraea sputorum]|uniref:DUF4148 domain-containing protein n=1 Tax=Pandoraea sputorum TaxID=93222 RepID=UPI001E3E9707|nr:DUF4148 domain-containing protein [Pandoraea sputorum]MCE4060056.1 DUF4148 domain-containing protein [Pandoraea sputorum]
MKTSILTSTFLATLAASSIAYAAPQTGLTRAEVRAELKALQDVGYTAADDNTRYPANLRMAQARLTQRSDRQAPAEHASADLSRTGVATGDAMATDKMNEAMQGSTAQKMSRSYAHEPFPHDTFRGQ